MNTNIFKDFDDYDEQSQIELQGIKFISFEDMERGIIGRDPFAGIRTDKIVLGETIRGMTNMHPLAQYKFYNRTTEDISKLYFPDAEKQFLESQGISLDIDIDCETSKALLVKSTDFFYDYNKNDKVDEGEFAFKLHIFASKDGLKLQEAFECASPKAGEMLVFIEDDKDALSRQVVRIKIAEDVRASIKQSDLYNQNVLNVIHRNTTGEGLSQEAFKQLVTSGEIIQTIEISNAFFTGLGWLLIGVSAPAKAIGWIVSKIADGIDYLKLPEKVWDTQNEDYLFTKETIINLLTIDTSFLESLERDLIHGKTTLDWNDLIPDFASKKITQLIAYLKAYVENYNTFIEQTVNTWFDNLFNVLDIQAKIALASGVYNGVIDFIVSTLLFIGDTLQSPFDILRDWQGFLETIDNIFDKIANINWDLLWEELQLFFGKLKDKLKNNEGEYDWVRIAYIIGFAIVFVGTMFIPIAGWLGKLSKAAKLDKLIPQELLVMLQKALSGYKQTTKNIKISALLTMDALLNIFVKGKQAIKAFFNTLVDEIVNWFIKHKKVYKLVDKVDTILLAAFRILKSNPNFIKCIELVKTPINKGGHGRHLGRWLAIESEAVIKFYTANTYRRLNKALRGIDNIKLDRELKAIKKILDDALDKLPISGYNKSHVLLRSAYFTEKEIKKLFKKGKGFTEKGFMSTTYSEKAMLQWLKDNPVHNVIFKVYGKNGKLIEKSSFLPAESEILFKSGTVFVVESLKRGVRHPLDKNKKVIEIILKEK